MGFKIKKIDFTRKIRKKIFGRNTRFGNWGYWKKKTGLNHLANTLRGKNSAMSVSASSDVYGPTGSIVGRF